MASVKGILRTDGLGQILWGSLDSQTQNTSVWSFMRYQISPDQNLLATRGLVVDTEMAVLPEDNPDYEWFRGASFGGAKITGGLLDLSSSVASPDLYYSFYYQRVEPFLGPTANCDIDVRFLVESGTRGSGDARLLMQDTHRHIELGALLYEDALGNRPRRLIDCPSLSYAGLYAPEDDPSAAWTSDGFITGTPYERVLTTSMAHPLGAGCFSGTLDPYSVLVTGTVQTEQTGPFYIPTDVLRGFDTSFKQELNPSDRIKTEDGRVFNVGVVLSQDEITLSAPAPAAISGVLYTMPSLDEGSRITQARVKVVSTTANDTGIYFTGTATSRIYTLVLRTIAGVNRVQLLDNGPAGAVLLSVVFNWNDVAFHDYRLNVDAVADNVVLSIDDTVYGNVALSAFAVDVTAKDLVFGHSNGNAVAAWETLSHVWQPPVAALRTLGVWTGGTPSDIDNWKLPRTDALPVPNSDPTAIIQAMDWTSALEVRIHRDPTFGVSVYRPDLIALGVFPPTWLGSPQFQSQLTDPTLAWINVEDTHLPEQTDEVFGSLTFGSTDPMSISRQLWDYVRYRVYVYPDEDYRAPQHMVLDYSNQIGSGDLGNDTTQETVIVESLDNRTVSLIPTNIYAKTVYRVLEGNTLISANYWTFDPSSQTVTLGYDSNGAQVTFSADHAAVTLVFTPGTPVTSTYLASLPLLQTATLLNEGTPPFIYQQAGTVLRTTPFGVVVVDPVTGMSIDNTPYQTLEFAPPLPIPNPGVNPIYQEATVYEIDNGAQQNIIAICDDSWTEVGLSGLPFSEQQAPGPHEVGAWPQGIGMPAGPLPAFVLAKASGGSYFGTQNVALPSPQTLVFAKGGLLGPNPSGMIILPDPKNPQVSVLIDNVPLYP